MKSKLTKLISLAMALTLVASFAACGKKGEEETTTGADASTEAVVTPDETLAEETVAGEETTAEETTAIVTDSEGHTKVVTQAPTKVVTSDPKKPTKPGNDTPVAKLPEGKDALIAAYNKGLGAMKGSQKRAVQNGSYIDAGKVGILNVYNEGNKNAEACKVIETANGTAAPKKLTAGEVASASAKGTADNYTITFKLNSVTKTMNQIKKGDGGYVEFVDKAEMQGMIPGIIKAAGLFGNATINGDKSTTSLTGGTYTVTVKNGQVTNITYSFTQTVELAANYASVYPVKGHVTIKNTVTYTK